jgi:hypothetical protein
MRARHEPASPRASLTAAKRDISIRIVSALLAWACGCDRGRVGPLDQALGGHGGGGQGGVQQGGSGGSGGHGDGGTGGQSNDGGGPDAPTDGPTRCESPTELAACAATYEHQIEAEKANCFAYPQAGLCGGYLVVVAHAGYLINRGCFYDSQTRSLVGSEDCSGDVYGFCDASSSCIHAGVALDPSCESLFPPGLGYLCPQDASTDTGG